MTSKEVLLQLESLANESTKAHYIKTGAHNNLYGVKLGDLRTIAKKFKVNHPLAMELWDTQNIDARLLAILIMNASELSEQELTEMVCSIDFDQVSDWFNAYILKDHPARDMVMSEWLHSKNIWAARSGWSLLAGKIARDSEGLSISEILDRIESEMPAAAPQVQWTMNTALAQTGIHHPAYRNRAMSIGERLGIYRNYPVSKGCTSPFAPIWISEMVKRQTK